MISTQVSGVSRVDKEPGKGSWVQAEFPGWSSDSEEDERSWVGPYCLLKTITQNAHYFQLNGGSSG